jgi:hypothetical protein
MDKSDRFVDSGITRKIQEELRAITPEDGGRDCLKLDDLATRVQISSQRLRQIAGGSSPTREELQRLAKVLP